MARIKLITDSGADIPKELREKYDITVLPICVIINGEVLYDSYTIHSRDYFKKLKELQEIPTTSMIPLEMMQEEFNKNLEDYDHQIFVTLSSKASGGNQAAHMLKNQIEEETGKPSNITILDSASYSMLYGDVVINMAKMVQNDASYDEIISYFEEQMPKRNAYFMVDDLMHLQKGGRIKPGIAVIGSLLGIKPVLTINDGLVDLYKKERGKIKALTAIVDYSISRMSDPSKCDIWIANGYADEDCKKVTQMLLSKIQPKSINEYDLGCVIGTHTGPGVVGILFTE